MIIFKKWIGQEGLRCWSKIPCRSPTISEIYANYHQDFVASMNSDFFQGQMDRGSFCWPNHSCPIKKKKKRPADAYLKTTLVLTNFIYKTTKHLT